MTAATFSSLFVAALAISLGLQLWLARRQMAHVAAHRDAVPAAFASRIGLAAHQRAADYTVARTRFGIVETLVEAVVLLLLTFGGGLAALASLTASRLDGPILRDLALIVAVAIVSGAVSLPFSYHRTFGIETKFGFNRTTRALWLADLARGLACRRRARPPARGADPLADARDRPLVVDPRLARVDRLPVPRPGGSTRP